MSKETSPFLDPQTSTSNILNRRGKSVRQFVQKIGKKKKNPWCCKALWVNIQTQKFTEIFENICILKTFNQPEQFLNYFLGLLKLILWDLMEILEATIPEFKEI